MTSELDLGTRHRVWFSEFLLRKVWLYRKSHSIWRNLAKNRGRSCSWHWGLPGLLVLRMCAGKSPLMQCRNSCYQASRHCPVRWSVGLSSRRQAREWHSHFSWISPLAHRSACIASPWIREEVTSKCQISWLTDTTATEGSAAYFRLLHSASASSFPWP